MSEFKTYTIYRLWEDDIFAPSMAFRAEYENLEDARHVLKQYMTNDGYRIRVNIWETIDE